MICCATQSYSAAAILQASMFSSSLSDGAGSSQNMTKHWLLLRWIVERQLYEPWLYNISFCIECRTGSRCLACLCFLLGRGFWSKMQTNALGNFLRSYNACFYSLWSWWGSPWATSPGRSPEFTRNHIHSELLAACVKKENAFNPMKDPSAPPSLRHWLERIGALVEALLEWSQTMEGLFWVARKPFEVEVSLGSTTLTQKKHAFVCRVL